MRFIKVLFIGLASIMMLSSCFKGSTTEQKYVLITTFKYNDLKMGADSLYRDSSEQGGYGWYDLGFMQKTNNEKDFLGGFILSGMCGRIEAVEGVPSSLYRAYLAKPVKGNPYSVFRYSADKDMMPENAITFISKKYGTCTPSGCFVTNSEVVASQVKELFEAGDKLTLNAKGYRDGTLTGEASITLAERTADKDTIISTWTPFEMTKLGSVDAINFEIVSTKAGVDLFVCMDDFYNTIELKY